MKIVHLCLSCFYIDNYSYQENMLPKYHVIQGHDVTVIASLVSFDKNGLPCLIQNGSTYISTDNYKVIRLDYKKPLLKINKFIRKYENLYSNLENEIPDIIFIHDFSFIDIKIVLKYIKCHSNVRIYIDCHTDYINSAKSWISKNIFHHIIWRHYAKKLTPYTKVFYGVTPLRCDFLRDAYKINERKIKLLVMGVDDDIIKNKNKTEIRNRLTNKYKFNDDDFIIITGGKIDKLKNIHLLLEAFCKISDNKLKLIVFGIIAPELTKEISKYKSNNKIVFVNWLDSDEVVNHILASDLAIFPGTHSVLWELAVGAGIPCIFKYWKGMEHVNVEGNCKFLYMDDSEEIRRVLTKITTNKDEITKMKTIATTISYKEFLYSNISSKAINE